MGAAVWCQAGVRAGGRSAAGRRQRNGATKTVLALRFRIGLGDMRALRVTTKTFSIILLSYVLLFLLGVLYSWEKVGKLGEGAENMIKKFSVLVPLPAAGHHRESFLVPK